MLFKKFKKTRIVPCRESLITEDLTDPCNIENDTKPFPSLSLKTIPSSNSMTLTVDGSCDDNVSPRSDHTDDDVGMLSKIKSHITPFQRSSRNPHSLTSTARSCCSKAVRQLRWDARHKYALWKNHEQNNKEKINDSAKYAKIVPVESNSANETQFASFEAIIPRLTILYCGEGERSRSNCEVLRQRDHTVYFVSSAKDAIGLFQKGGAYFNTIIVEIDSPLINGKQLLDTFNELISRNSSVVDDDMELEEDMGSSVVTIATSYNRDVENAKCDLSIPSPFNYTCFVGALYGI